MDSTSSGDAFQRDLRRRIEKLLVSDFFSTNLNIKLVHCEKGKALLSMLVTQPLMNAHGSCHGGTTWTLADMAFGAAGYYDGPILTLGSDLTFIRPALEGDTIYATGTEITRRGLTGLFQIVLQTRLDDPSTVIATGMFSGRWVNAG